MSTDREFDVLVIGGCGHVGLPLGILLADKGKQVALCDIDESARAKVAQGEMPFLEYDAEPVLKRVIGKSLHLVDGIQAVSRARNVIITIGTPVDEYLNPKLLPILNLADQMAPYLREDHHLMLRSTVFPGTTRRLHEYLAEKGKTVHMSFCPERIVQGYAIRELGKLPQIVSGLSEEAVARAKGLFSGLPVELVEVEVLEAELAKLFTNAWRYLQFAIANQFYMMAADNGVDFYRIHYAMTHGYARAQDFPKAGFAAGPCLLKDTLQLAAFYQNSFQLGQSAMAVNEGLPGFIVRQLKQKFDLKKEVIGLMGMAFKAEVDDIRDSLSYKLGKLLRFHGAQVLYTDEYAQDPTFITKEQMLESATIVVLCTPHQAYRKLKIPDRIHLVDVWGIWRTMA